MSGQSDQAIQYLEKSLKIAENVFCNDHLLNAMILNNICVLYCKNSDRMKVVEIIEKLKSLYNTHNKNSGDNNEDVIRIKDYIDKLEAAFNELLSEVTINNSLQDIESEQSVLGSTIGEE